MAYIAMELLNGWKAPIRDLDPWRPETITPQQLKSLDAWARDVSKKPASAPAQLEAPSIEDAGREDADAPNRLLFDALAYGLSGVVTGDDERVVLQVGEAQPGVEAEHRGDELAERPDIAVLAVELANQGIRVIIAGQGINAIRREIPLACCQTELLIRTGILVVNPSE